MAKGHCIDEDKELEETPMTLLDANVLLYNHNEDSAQHQAVAAWLGEQRRTGETIGLSWITLWAFLRISTNPKLWPTAKSVDGAWRIVQEWLRHPAVVMVEPGSRHAEILESLMREERVTGPKVTDAALAALAIEYGAVLASSDRDFRRFPSLKWVNPAA
ncbi:MAG TPA: TA system VapC family ribonuclease toxin [Bryobacteraceae bacterium]|nr:TA system VapC family ribonuclease toxin [Bryobacteraceae bacterium]